MLSSAMAVLAASASRTSDFVRLDTRDATAALLLQGTERISPVAENADPTAQLLVDGKPAKPAAGWTVANPLFDSSTLGDGAHSFALYEGGKEIQAKMVVLNADDVVIHGGVLAASETWAAGKTHVVRDWVRIPEGMTLTIANGAIVKFGEETGIRHDGTLSATNVIFTTINDDNVGAITSNGNAEPEYGLYAFTGDGTATLKSCVMRYGTAPEQPIAPCTVELAYGWNLFSMPFMPDNDTKDMLVNRKVFSLDGGTMVRATSFKAGRSYWTYRAAGDEVESFDLVPDQAVQATAPTLVSGWNFIGPVMNAPQWDSEEDPWAYLDGRWKQVDKNFETGHGYFVWEPYFPAASENQPGAGTGAGAGAGTGAGAGAGGI